ncbi:hypothetical protein [Bifidobacterium pseudolongum]|uniref:hypothetical protein n=1 Tax=Bifidobacterium pseudolongum TaxID=1694 RepID=UPI001C3E2D87|nr:hypothetical protein [Bifidobacterium pseudolongum]
MAKRNGTIHEIIETNRRRPWRHAPSAHWTALILTGILSAPTIADTIRDRDPCMLMASLGLAIVFFLVFETALYLISPPSGTKPQGHGKGHLDQPNR